MKVYTRLVIDGGGKVLEENSYEYTGPIAWCKGGSSQTATQQQTNPQVKKLVGQGWNFLRPSVEGGSFAPVTGIRDVIEPSIMSQIPLLQNQVNRASQLP